MGKKQNNKTTLAVVAIAAGAAALAGTGYFVANPMTAKPEPKVEQAGQKQDVPIKVDVRPDDPQKVTALEPKLDGDDVKFEQSDDLAPAGEDPKLYAVNKYLDTLSIVPKEAKLLNYNIENKVATLNFNEAIMAGYGTSDEMVLVNGVLTLMGTFKDVDAVRFQVEGENVDTFGSADLSTPLKVLR